MSKTAINNIMINTVKQLNSFVDKMGVKSPNLIIPALVSHKELVSPNIAKLIMQKSDYSPLVITL